MSSALRAADHGTAKRLRSIIHDSEFVQQLASEYGLPIVANERCGLWYVPPSEMTDSVYFKSTDGHLGEWRFSFTRLNLHLLELIGKSGGCIIVDSTTRGKSLPDALSKTIPIWCCVLNNILFPQDSGATFNSGTIQDSGATLNSGAIQNSAAMYCDYEGLPIIDHPLETPLGIISQNERSRILTKMTILIGQARHLIIDVERFCTALNNKPLRLRFMTPDRPLAPSSISQLLRDDTRDYHTIICCSASHHTISPFEDYIQGAGDDSENWAHGLTPQTFWKRRDELMHVAEQGDWALTDAITEIVAEEQNGSRADGQGQEMQKIMPIQLGNMKLYIGPTPATGGDMHGFDVVVVCADNRPADEEIIHSLQQQTDPGTKILRLPCGKGKNGSRALRTLLPRLITLIESFNSPISRILVACDTEGNLSLGVALVLSCLFYDNEGNMHRQRREVEFDKDIILRRLTDITVAVQHVPEARLWKMSRATMQSVKAFLMPGKPE